MDCSNQQCNTSAQVLLTQTTERPTWFCAFCAAKFLQSTNPESFKSKWVNRTCKSGK